MSRTSICFLSVSLFLCVCACLSSAPVVIKPTQTAPAPIVCPMDWHLFNNSCYFISRISRDWPESQSFCQSKGAHLAIIHTAEEQVQYDKLRHHNMVITVLPVHQLNLTERYFTRKSCFLQLHITEHILLFVDNVLFVAYRRSCRDFIEH